MAFSERRLEGMQAKDGHLCLIHRREAGAPKGGPHLPAGETRTHRLLRLPDTDDVQRVLAYRAVVAQLPWRATGVRDLAMRSVVGLGQLFYISAEASDQQRR